MDFGIITWNQKNGEKAKLCYMDTDSLIVYKKNKIHYIDIMKDVETRFDTSNKGTKKCAIKQKLKFENHKNCLEATRLEKEFNYLEEIKLM